MAGSGVILTSDLDRAIAERGQIWAAYDEASGHGAALAQLESQIKFDGVVTALAVEDEPTLCAQLVHAITAAGHTVESASDGIPAQDMIRVKRDRKIAADAAEAADERASEDAF